MQIYFVDTVFAFIFSKFAVAGILSNYLIIKCLPIMTKHVPLFYLSEVFGYWRYSSLLYNLCSSGIGWQNGWKPRTFRYCFHLAGKAWYSRQVCSRDGLYFHSFRYIGAVPLLFFMQRQMKKLRERDRERYLQLLEGILDNLPIAAKVKDVNDGMRYTFWNKRQRNSLNVRPERL